MGRYSDFLFKILVVFLVFCVSDGVWAFGAGNIPSVCLFPHSRDRSLLTNDGHQWAYMEVDHCTMVSGSCLSVSLFPASILGACLPAR